MANSGAMELTIKQLWMRRILTGILIIMIIIGVFLIYQMSKVPEGKYVTVVLSETNHEQNYKALQMIRKNYGEFSQVVIISPQDVQDEFGFFESFPESGQYCYADTCVSGDELNKNIYLGVTSGKLFTKNDNKKYIINSPSLGITISSLAQIFPDIESYHSFVLKRHSKDDLDVRKLKAEVSIRGLGSTNILFVALSDIDTSAITTRLSENKMDNYQTKISQRRDMSYDSSCNNCIAFARLIANRLGNQYFTLMQDKNYGIFTNIPKQEKVENITGLWFGDTHFTRAFTSGKFKEEPEYFSCFINTKHIGDTYYHVSKIGVLDILGANLKTVVATPEVCKQSASSIVTLPEKLQYFKDMGFTHASLANNNTYTCGSRGYQATKDSLSSYDIEPFGMDISENKISYIEKDGQKVALMGLSDTLARIPLCMVKDDIMRLKNEGYNVIVTVNWGAEYTLKPNNRQKYLAHQLVDYGADMILGYHPHILQEIEEYKGKKIYYSLGNFMYDQPFENTLKGGAVYFELGEKGLVSQLITFVRDPQTYKINCESIVEEK